jgi:tight adherence protein B
MAGPVAPGEVSVQQVLLFGGLILFFGGVSAIVALTLSLMSRQPHPEERIRQRLSPYGVVQRHQRTGSVDPEHRQLLPDLALTRSAIAFSNRVMRRQGLDTVIDAKLETAGLPLRTGEWMLVHLGSFVLCTASFFVISGARPPAAVLGAMVGGGTPWLVLILYRDHRRRRFLTQLPDTLQLLAGSLQAGYSLQQAISTLVNEADPPISTEFHRVLAEHSLGRPLEDSLEDMGRRLDSKDFAWVVMAIRVQHDVGGNLAELLSTVATTLRERDRLRRQVRALSAEGRLSGWILGLLPLVFAIYLSLVRPEYLSPLVGTPLGWLLLGAALVLYVSGAIWMTRVVRVEV